MIPSSLIFSTRFCKIMSSSQVTNTVAGLAFFDQEKAQLPAIRITEQPMLLIKNKNSHRGYTFFKYFC